MDYYGKLSAQLDWQNDAGERPFGLYIQSSGEPTAALLDDDDASLRTCFLDTCKENGLAKRITC